MPNSIIAHVELPVSLLNPPAAPNQAPGSASTSAAPQAGTSITKEKKKKHHLTTATDPLLAELRDLNFSAVGKKLNQVARRLDEDYKVILWHTTGADRYLQPFKAQAPGKDRSTAERLCRKAWRLADRASSVEAP